MDRLEIQDCRLSSLIDNINAKCRVVLFEKDTDKILFNGYAYQLYDRDMEKSIQDYYIYDMLIDFDGFRIVIYKKW
jgi:hypothetical protein